MEARNAKNHDPLKVDDFRLLDYRIVSIKAERFIDPISNEVDDGTSRSKLEATAIAPMDDKSDVAAAEFTYHLNGFSRDKNEKEVPHFSVSVCAEFLYKAGREGTVEDSDFDDIIQSFALQAYPLLVVKVRGIAHEMGFDGVDPDLGLRISSRPETQKKAIAKSAAAKKRAPRRTA
ncbi:hypothetical protein [Burkholderia lata]|uniref:hypothetical protein n=1 Tax=Burkholderia lata (strain ATCC 17760 / DSM 23089 / LMG 22485 / NCIMB 9086 / R18194 / 383) TaxID=482957 RepID=UPI0015837A4D|nr:hypothetical protein [Burkholderia lata]